jgi:hypothetical protein
MVYLLDPESSRSGGERQVKHRPPSRHHPRLARDEALRFARTCYDHMAGQVGVAITDSLVAMGHVVLTDQGGEVTINELYPVGSEVERLVLEVPEPLKAQLLEAHLGHSLQAPK